MLIPSASKRFLPAASIGLAMAISHAHADQFVLRLAQGWNLISTPIVPLDPEIDAVFGEAAAGSVWTWDNASGNYEPAARFEPGVGYWVLRNETAVGGDPARPLEVVIHGSPPREQKRTLTAGWHLIGVFGAAPYAPLPLPARDATTRSR